MASMPQKESSNDVMATTKFINILCMIEQYKHINTFTRWVSVAKAYAIIRPSCILNTEPNDFNSKFVISGKFVPSIELIKQCAKCQVCCKTLSLG